MSIITTPRLVLRPWREIDYMDMYDYAKSPLVGPNAGWFPHRSPEESRQAVRNILRNSRCDTWAITLKETEKPIGSIGLNRRSPVPRRIGLDQREIGYVLNPKYWGQGFMPEAVHAIMDHAFLNMGVDVLWCAHYDFNANSKRVIEKCGFQFQFGRYEIRYQMDGKRLWSLFYSLGRKEYLKRPDVEEKQAYAPKFNIEGV